MENLLTGEQCAYLLHRHAHCTSTYEHCAIRYAMSHASRACSSAVMQKHRAVCAEHGKAGRSGIFSRTRRFFFSPFTVGSIHLSPGTSARTCSLFCSVHILLHNIQAEHAFCHILALHCMARPGSALSVASLLNASIKYVRWASDCTAWFMWTVWFSWSRRPRRRLPQSGLETLRSYRILEAQPL